MSKRQKKIMEQLDQQIKSAEASNAYWKAQGSTGIDYIVHHYQDERAKEAQKIGRKKK